MLPASAAPAERFSQCFPHRQPQRSGKLFRTDFRFDPSLRSAPASNKPHPAEKSTPVWLAIWRTWAGFANSQLRRAALRCTYSYICTHPRYCRLEQLLRQTQIFRPIFTDCLRHLRIIRQMRLLHGRGVEICRKATFILLEASSRKRLHDYVLTHMDEPYTFALYLL